MLYMLNFLEAHPGYLKRGGGGHKSFLRWGGGVIIFLLINFSELNLQILK